MNPINYWHLADELNVIQATLLILNIDPTKDQDRIENWSAEELPLGYSAISTALINSIQSNILPAIKCYNNVNFGEDFVLSKLSTIKIEDLMLWLTMRKCTDNFFFNNQFEQVQDFLNPANKCYAPKLGAAVAAWKAVTADNELLDGKTPKQALDKWLRQNANQYGLTKDDGNPNESAIEEISKIANWSPLGGVAKTTPQVQKNPPTPLLN